MHTEPSQAPRLLSLAETRARLSVGRTQIFQLIKRGELVAVRIGARTLVRESDLAEFVARLESARPTTIQPQARS